jgi:hypothetical protein
MNQKPSPLDYISQITKAILSVICVLAICLAMFYKNYSDPATLSALFLLTGTLIGGLGRSQAPGKTEASTNGETTMTSTTQTQTVTKPKAPEITGDLIVTKQPEVAIIPDDKPPVQGQT